MPITRQHVWINRPQEKLFSEWVTNKKPLYWPITGSGGSGKTSLLRKFHEYSSKNEIPSVFIDPSKLISRSGSNGLSFLLSIETINTPSFNKLRESIISSTKQLSSILLDSALNSGETLKSISSQVKDEEWGLVIGTIKDTLKIARSTIDHKNQKNLEIIKEKPEELLIKALYTDLSNGGLILVDTWEQSSSLEVISQLDFKDDGEIDTLNNIDNAYSLRDYLSGIIYYTFDLNVLFVVAGRHVPAEITSLDRKNIATKSSTVPFSQSEIKQYLDKAIGKKLSTDTKYIRVIHKLTHGNPLLVSKLALLIKEETGLNPNWTWDDWKLTKDEEFNILETLVERLIITSDIDIDSFWRIAIPKNLYVDLFNILFFDNPSSLSGKRILTELEEKGILYKAANTRQIYIHDEIKDAIKSYAMRKGYWLSESAINIHGRLAEYYYQKGHSEKHPQYTLEGSYHALMSDSRFEKRYSVSREEFWRNVENSLSLNVEEKKRIIDNITSLSPLQINQLIEVFTEEKERFAELIKLHPEDMIKLCLHQKFGDIHEALTLFYKYVENMPNSMELFLYLAKHKDFSNEERVNWYLKAIEHDSSKSKALVQYAIYLYDENEQISEAKKIFIDLLKSNNRTPHILVEWLKYCHRYLSESKFDKQIKELLNNGSTKNEVAIYILNHKETSDFLKRLLRDIIDPGEALPDLLVTYSKYIFNQEGDKDRSLSILTDALNYNDDNELLLSTYAEFQELVLKDYQKANEVYLKLRTSKLNDIQLILRHANLLAFKLGNLVEARKLFNQILELDEYQFETIVLLGRISWSEHNYQESEKYFRLALSLAPTDVELLLHVGLILVSKDNSRGVKLIQMALNGKVSSESFETQLLTWFYGFCLKNNIFNRIKILQQIKTLIEKHHELSLSDFHTSLFANTDINNYFEWGTRERTLHDHLFTESIEVDSLLQYIQQSCSELEKEGLTMRSTPTRENARFLELDSANHNAKS